MTRLTIKEALLSVLSGVLTALAMPGFGVAPLIFVSFVPLFWVLRERGGFAPGFLFGVAFFALDLRWIVTLARFHPIVIGGYLLLAVYLAAGIGLLGFLLSWRRQSDALTWVLLAPALFVLAEFLRTLGPLGMGFSTVYSALYRAPWMIQSAAWFGPWFISGLAVAVNGSLLLVMKKRRVGFAVAAASLFVLMGAGWMPRGVAPSQELSVAVVSSKVRQEVKLDARNLPDLTTRYFELADRAIAGMPDLVVFPESILPTYILQNPELMRAFADLARRGSSDVLIGTGLYEDREIRNVVAWIDETGGVAGTYAMVRPVPFGEYIPGRGLLERLGLGAWARSLLPVDLTRGEAYVTLGHIGTPICFESTFPLASRQLTRAGAGLLVTVTNDAWFAESSELKAHFASAVFRAVENRRWVLQSANGGISGIIAPDGAVIEMLNAEGVVTGDVALMVGRSLYTRWGDGFVLVLSGVAVFAVCGYRIRRARNAKRRGRIRGPAPS